MSNSTPFQLGAYLGNPDDYSAANQATFDSNFTGFSSLMGATPTMLTSFIDQRQAVSSWVGNSQWAASSAAASANTDTMTPVIAMPLSSLASGAGTSDQQFLAFASGQYDGVIQGIVQAWAQQGFKNLVFRPGWEMNIEGPTYAGDDAKSQADWVAAFQHVYTVLHQAAAAAGVSVQVAWNPATTNYSNAEATTNLYPGDSYVDLVAADAYSDIQPYSDGGTTPTYHDWDTGKEDTTTAQFIADPVNRMHYWSAPAATEWSSDGSGGHSQSLTSLIQFATAHGKAFAIPEAGAGDSDAGTDVQDDAAYPQWLSQQLLTAQASGTKVSFVSLWDSNGGGDYEFSAAGDNKPLEAAAWAKYFGASTPASPSTTPPPVAAAPASTVTPVTVTVPATTTVATPVKASAPAALSVGSGSHTLALQLAEDAWNGDAQFTVSVDGTQIGGTMSATASHAAGQTQLLNVLGSFAAGSHAVSVDFLNDAYGGTSATDRNLYVASATIDGTAVSGSSLALLSGGSQGFSFVEPAAVPALVAAPTTVTTAAPTTAAPMTAAPTAAATTAAATTTAAPAALSVGSGADTLALQLSEDAWSGDAQFTVSVDGTQVGGTMTATASHAAGQTQLLNVLGSFAAGSHAVSVDFLNDAYGGTSATDRNLYVASATIDGTAVSGSSLALLSGGSQGFSFVEPAAATAADVLDLHVSEDAFQGDAQYSIAIDGTTIGGVRTATALHGAGATQDVSLSGSWGSGAHTVAISFLNDAYGGTSTTDRNLYVDGVTYDGQAAGGAPAALMSNGTASFAVAAAPVGTTLGLHLAEDAWSGDAQYSVAVDGKVLVQNATVTALHGLGQSQLASLQATLSAGSHDLAISFLNDAYGGTSTTDRNLYVTGVDVNGTALPGASASLMSDGTAHFQFVVPSH